MIRIFCDICKKGIERNMVEDRLVVEQGDFKAEVLLSYKGVSNNGDLCLDCLLKMLTKKPKRKYVRKVALPAKENDKLVDNEVLITESKSKRKKKDKVVDTTITVTDTVTIKVPYPGGPEEYEVTIGEAKGQALILKLAVERALAPFGLAAGELPNFCTETDRKLLSGILGI